MYQPYGAVHIYSGVSRVNAFPPVPNPKVPYPDYLVPQLWAKLAIANRHVWKQVHNLVGLDKVFDTII
jgi:hypothetical protein